MYDLIDNLLSKIKNFKQTHLKDTILSISRMKECIMGYNIKLKKIKLCQSKQLFKIYSDSKVCKFYDMNPLKDLVEAEDQIIKWDKLEKERRQIRYGIFYNEELIGTCGIYSIYWHQNRANIGYDLNSHYWNRGITTCALEILLAELKNKYNFHRIQATLLESNIPSKKVLQKIGFKFDGLLRDYEKWRECYVNLEMYSKIL